MFVGTSWRQWNDAKDDYSYGLGLKKLSLGSISGEITEEYNFKLFEVADSFEDHLGSRIDVANTVTLDGVETDAWFICASQDIFLGPAVADWTSFISVGLEDTAYAYSVQYIY